MERKNYLEPRIDVVDIEMESLLNTVSSETDGAGSNEEGGSDNSDDDLAKMKWTLWDEE